MPPATPRHATPSPHTFTPSHLPPSHKNDNDNDNDNDKQPTMVATTRSMAQKVAKEEASISIESLTEDVAAMTVAPPEHHQQQQQQQQRQEHQEEETVQVTTVEEFVEIVETVPVEQWKERTEALDSLVVHVTTKRTSPATLNRQEQESMAPAVSVLLKDPRSSVVKLTCQSLVNLFQKLRVDGAVLLKEIFPTVLEIAGVTLTVIRNLVQDMVEKSLPNCPHDGIVTMLLETLQDPSLKNHKTKKEASVLYLSLVLKHWHVDAKRLSNVGIVLVGELRGATPSIRAQARHGLQVIRTQQPDLWKELVHQSNGRDSKLQKWLEQSLEHPTVSLEKLSSSSSSTVSGPSKFAKFRAMQKQQQQQNGTSTSNSDNVLVI